MLPRHRRPEVLLVLPPDVAGQVEPPLAAAAGVAERLEGNPELGGPAGRVHRRRHVPGPVPVEVRRAGLAAGSGAGAGGAAESPFPFLGDLAVVLDPRRRRAEDEGVLPVVVGVEHDEERVLLGEIGVAPDLAPDDPGGVGVVEPHPDVEGVLVEEDPHLGALGGRRPGERLVLDERAQHRGLRPD